MSALVIKQPQTDEELNNYYQLRWHLLSKPWGQPISVSQDDKEQTSYHLTAIYNNELVGISRLHFNSKSEAQIRYMGVKETHQKKGIGRELVESLEQYAKEKECKTVILNARENAILFYKKLGYSYLADAHTIFGLIKHEKMIKTLTSKS